MKLLSPALSRLARFRYWKVEEWMHHPLMAQRMVWQDLLSQGQYAAIGKQYHFKDIYTIEEFKKILPIQSYNDIEPLIKRMMLGKHYQLWNTKINWFAKSSGTTNSKSKFIPISEENLKDCHYQAAKDVLTLYYHFNPQSDILTGKGLVIGGSNQVYYDNIIYGDLSAVLLQNSPFWGEWIRTPDLKIALMSDWEKKIEEMAIATIPENITSISGVPTWTLMLLKYILHRTGKKTIKEVWPNLELYIHGGISFVPYQLLFNEIIGGDAPIHYLEMYNASEGFFAAQQFPNDNGMLLFLQHGIYYEFLPIEKLNEHQPSTCSLQEVQLNKVYALIISTTSGLWRYMVGDTIVFTSLFPFKIKVAGRTQHFINAFGEEVMVHQADQALYSACKQCNVSVLDYTVAPIYFSEKGKGAHQWVIAFESPPADVLSFAIILDNHLQILNSDYEAKRQKDIAVQLPHITVVPHCIFLQWLKENNKLGGQHKIPRLSNDRIFLDALLKYCDNN